VNTCLKPICGILSAIRTISRYKPRCWQS
jgi:hypothetical protein